MKKITIVIILCLCVLLCSCGRMEPVYAEPTNFYYCNQTVSYNSSVGLISPEVRESAEFNHDIGKFMEAYLRGPVSDELYPIIPKNAVLLSVEIEENTATLNFSKEFAELSGIDLTTAGVGIVKSLYDYAGIETVTISAEEALLDERESFTLSLEDIVTMDTVTIEE